VSLVRGRVAGWEGLVRGRVFGLREKKITRGGGGLKKIRGSRGALCFSSKIKGGSGFPVQKIGLGKILGFFLWFVLPPS
jgi:hypothetical protein